MEYKNESLESRMVVKDRPTVSEQLTYRAKLSSMSGDNMYIIAWEAAKGLIEEWECPHVSMEDDLNTIDNPSAADAISWGGMQVFQYFKDLEDVPKN